MLSRLARARETGDQGAVAILTAIVVVFILIPLSAVAIGSYTRSGVGAEVNRAGDSGALAGASGMGLANLGALSPTQLTDLLDPLLPVASTKSALETACVAALRAYGVTSAATAATTSTSTRYVSGAVVDPTANDNSPLGRAFNDLVGCRSAYTPDPIFSQCIGQITPVLTNVLGATLAPIQALLALVNAVPLVGPALSRTLGTALLLPNQLNAIVLNLLPALTHDGVTVDLDYKVRGPFDSVLGKGDGTLATNRSSARRVFKSLLPAGISALATPFNNPSLTTLLKATDPLVTSAETLVVAQLQLVLGVLRSITDPTGVPVATLKPLVDNVDGVLQDLLGSALTNVTQLVGLGAIRLPSLSGITTPCLSAVDDLLADLQSALTINNDPADQDLLHCLTEQVLGLPVLGLLQRATLVTTQSCVNRIFRAQIGPNPTYAQVPR